MFAKNKSTCILAMPRTGSTLLQEYLSAALQVQNAGEFFALSKVRIRRVTRESDTGIFNRDYQLVDYPDMTDLSEQEYRDLAHEECQRRLEFIRDFEQRHGGIVFKVFASRFMRDSRIDLAYFSSNFNMVVLYRKNVFHSILSEFVCMHLDTWHEFDKSKVRSLQDRVEQVQIYIPENQFMQKLKEHMYLGVIARNINDHCSHAQVLCYEDFDTNSVNQLNKILGFDIQHEPVVNKFIQNHESHISNIDRLRQLYTMFKPH